MGKTGMYGKFVYAFTVVCEGLECKKPLERKIIIIN
jgi:hypothetical protein